MPLGKKTGDRNAAEIAALLHRTKSGLMDALLADIDPAGLSPTDYDRFLAQQKAAALDDAIARLESEALSLAGEQMRAAAMQATSEVQQALGSQQLIGVDEKVLAFVQDFAGTQIKDVLSVVRQKVNMAVQQAAAGALSYRDLQKAVSDAFGGNVTMARIERIVRTETIRAYSQAEAATTEKLAQTHVADQVIKVWRTAGDTRVREEHALIDGQERELDELFNVGQGATASTPPGGTGFPANGPADPSLPPELSIQCRCTVEYVPRSRAVQPYTEKDPEKAAEKRRRRMAA